MNAGMGARSKRARDIRVTLKARFVADELCARYRWSLDNSLPENSAGKSEKQTG